VRPQAVKDEERAVAGALRSLAKDMQVDSEAVAAIREARPPAPARVARVPL